MSQILNDFKLYQDEFGLNQIHTQIVERLDGPETVGVTEQNGTLCTMEYLLCFLASDAPQEEKDSEIERVKAVFFQCQKDPGYSVRYPGCEEFDSMDNNAALLIFSSMFDNGNFAKEMKVAGQNVVCTGYDQLQDLERNKKYYWLYKLLGLPYWNNQDPTKFCFVGWFGRSPGFMAILDLCANEATSIFRYISLGIGQFLSWFSEPGNTSGRKLEYLTWQFLKKRGFIWKLLYKLWCWRLMKVYPLKSTDGTEYLNSGMKTVYTIWYRSLEHPLVVHSKEYIE